MAYMWGEGQEIGGPSGGFYRRGCARNQHISINYGSNLITLSALGSAYLALLFIKLSLNYIHRDKSYLKCKDFTPRFLIGGVGRASGLSQLSNQIA